MKNHENISATWKHIITQIKLFPKKEKSDGTIITKQSSILKEAKHFYEHLYSNKDEELSDINVHQDLADIMFLHSKRNNMMLLKNS